MSDKTAGILKREDLDAFRIEHRGEIVVFTNGCFDLIHPGHVSLLSSARRFGDCLVVGINSDDSVRRLKGKPRPLMDEQARAFVLLQLRCVDYVTVFSEDTPYETIRALSPNVLVKGAEYERGEIVGADHVEAMGGRVERVAMLDGYSTSDLIDRMRQDA
jgi:rfaE bifunctional protein nucleotidyltransferase chain/domain